jgi:hypothetical protein
MLGTNDVKEHLGASVFLIARGVERLVERIQTGGYALGGASPEILVIAPARLGAGIADAWPGPEFGPHCLEKDAQLAALYQKVAEKHGLHFLNAADVAEVSPDDCVHLSAAAQIGGVLEPAGALPVIIEDEVLVGGNCGVYEGTMVRERAVLAPGTILTRGTTVFDLVHDRIYRREGDQPLEIPAGAVVVPGSRPVTSGTGKAAGIGLYAPVIVKYRDEKTDTAVRLEELLR